MIDNSNEEFIKVSFCDLKLIIYSLEYYKELLFIILQSFSDSLELVFLLDRLFSINCIIKKFRKELEKYEM